MTYSDLREIRDNAEEYSRLLRNRDNDRQNRVANEIRNVLEAAHIPAPLSLRYALARAALIALKDDLRD